MSADVDVVIVGGGAAGIGAARRLSDSGLSTLLFEATSRLGGRGWTRSVAGIPLDLGCGWLHSADRNAWTAVAEAAGATVDRRTPAWGVQYKDLGFTRQEQAEARRTFTTWLHRLAHTPPLSDRASDALEAGGAWNDYVQAMIGFISGATLADLSIADYMAYDAVTTDHNWRVPSGYGHLIATSFPAGIGRHLATPVRSIALEAQGVTLATPRGTQRARAAILTVSTAVLSGDAIELPAELEPWRQAARLLPLGRNEKFFLEVLDEGAFASETHVLGDPRDARTGSYYIRPFGRPVIECFFGGEGARVVEAGGQAAGFDYAIEQLAALFGHDVRRTLRPLAASDWGGNTFVGGAYSYALPRHAAARDTLARPFDERLFFAGEATSPGDFSTAHGAHDSGVRAAEQVIVALASAPVSKS